MRALANNEQRPEKIVQALREVYDERGFGVFASSGAAGAALTGGTAETVLATVKIPGRLLGPKGAIRVWPLFSFTNSANLKSFRLRFGGSLLGSFFATTSATGRFLWAFQNRDSAALQVAIDGGGLGTATAAVLTAAIDTTVEQALTITGQLANAGESITLQSYIVEVYRKS